MTGTVFLGGGGSALDEAALWRRMLHERRRIVYWPFALPPDRIRNARAWLVSSLADLHLDTDAGGIRTRRSGERWPVRTAGGPAAAAASPG